MSDEKKYTERDMVVAKREAFIAGTDFVRTDTGHDAVQSCSSCRSTAERRYPLPRVTRPRVADDPHGAEGFDQQWRVRDGVIEWKGGRDYGVWMAAEFEDASGCLVATPKRIRMWADLLANPQETVEDES